MKFKSSLDTNILKENSKLFENHLKDLQKMANNNVININVNQSMGDLNNIKDNLKGIGDSGIGAGKGIKTLSDSFGSLTGFYTRWLGVSSAVNFALGQTKNAIQEIIDINKINTNIAVISGESVANVEKYNDAWMDIAKNTGVVFSEVAKGSEGWLRAGEKIDDANKLTQTSIQLSKLSGMTAEQSAESLVKIKEAWKMNVAEVGNYSSKVSLLDNQSSSSSEKISKGMLYASQSFKDAGIGIDESLALITNASENSARSGESLGRGWVSILTNFKKFSGNVKDLNDQETDALNKSEMLMTQKGIALRKNKDEFRAIGDVIKDISTNIKKFSEVEKEQLFFNLAGKENSELLRATVNNYQHVIELQQKVSQETGTKTLNDATAKSLQELDSKIANLRNTWTQFYRETISSNFVKKGVDDLTSLVNTLKFLMTEGKSTTIILGGLLLTIANFSKVASAVEMVTTAFKYLGTFGLESLTLLNFNPIILGLTAMATLVGVVAYKHSQAFQQMKAEADSLKGSFVSLEESLKNMETINTSDKRLQDWDNKTKKVRELKNELDEVNKRIEQANKNENKSDQLSLGSTLRERDELIKKIQDENKALKENGITLEDYYNLRNKIDRQNYANSIKEEATQIWNQRESISNLRAEYETLSNAENKSENNKIRLNQVVQDLNGKVKGLSVSVDENGRMVINNCSEIDKQINLYSKEGMTIEGLQNAMLQQAKLTYELEKGNTATCYTEISKRIKMRNAEFETLQKGASNTDFLIANEKDPATKAFYEKMKGKLGDAIGAKGKEIEKLKGDLSEIDRIFSTEGAKAPNVTPNYNDNDRYTPKVTDDSSSSKKEKEAKKDSEILDMRIEKTRAWQEQLNQVNSQMSKISKMIDDEKSDENKVSLIKEQLKLLEQKSTLNDTIYQSDLESLNASKELLKSFGFQINEQTGIIENEQHLIDLTNYSNSLHGEERESQQSHVKRIKEEMDNVYYKLLNNTQKSREEWQNLNSEANKFKEQIDSINKEIRDKTLKQINEILEKAVYGKQGKKEFEFANKQQQEALKRELESLREQEEFRKEQEDRANRVKEITEIQLQLDAIRSGKLKEMTEAEAKKLGLEEQRKKILDHELWVKEQQLKIDNVMANKNVQLYSKDATGNFDFSYTFDQGELDRLNKEMADKTNQFSSDNLNKVDELEKKLKDKQEDFNKWEQENLRKHNEEKIQKQIEALQQELDKRQEFLDLTKERLTVAFENEQLQYTEQGKMVNEIVNKTMSDLNVNYKVGFDNIKDTIQIAINEINALMAQLGSAKGDLAIAQGGGGGISIPSGGDSDFARQVNYLNNNQDVAIALKNGVDSQGNKITFKNAFEHWQQFGQFENRRFDKGGLTGRWGSDPKWAMLDEQELILNKAETGKIINVDKIASLVDFSKSIIDRVSPNLNTPSIIPNGTNRGTVYKIDKLEIIAENIKDTMSVDKMAEAFDKVLGDGLSNRALQFNYKD